MKKVLFIIVITIMLTCVDICAKALIENVLFLDLDMSLKFFILVGINVLFLIPIYSFSKSK